MTPVTASVISCTRRVYPGPRAPSADAGHVHPLRQSYRAETVSGRHDHRVGARWHDPPGRVAPVPPPGVPAATGGATEEEAHDPPRARAHGHLDEGLPGEGGGGVEA